MKKCTVGVGLVVALLFVAGAADAEGAKTPASTVGYDPGTDRDSIRAAGGQVNQGDLWCTTPTFVHWAFDDKSGEEYRILEARGQCGIFKKSQRAAYTGEYEKYVPDPDDLGWIYTVYVRNRTRPIYVKMDDDLDAMQMQSALE